MMPLGFAACLSGAQKFQEPSRPKGKASWYLKLERYSSSTVFIKNAEALTSNFPAAQKKIEELKASNGK